MSNTVEKTRKMDCHVWKYGTTVFLRLNMCFGISRSFDYPIVNPLPPSPELYEKNTTEKERKKIYEKLRAENIKIALSDLKLEIIALRERRDEE